MFWSNDEVPYALRAVGLSLEQANEWNGLYETFIGLGAPPGDASSRAWMTFKRRSSRLGEVVMSKVKLTEQFKSALGALNEEGRRNNSADRGRIFDIVKHGIDLLNPADRAELLSTFDQTNSPALGIPKSATQESIAAGKASVPEVCTTSGRTPTLFSRLKTLTEERCALIRQVLPKQLVEGSCEGCSKNAPCKNCKENQMKPRKWSGQNGSSRGGLGRLLRNGTVPNMTVGS